MLATVIARHAGAQVALCEVVEHGGSLLDGRQHRIERLVHPVHDLPEVAFVPSGVGARVELAGHRSHHEAVRVLDEP
ncbi:MAG TPA: hypothetical protein VEM76_00225 [Anaeromyxobacteraceae bacterium]|nr:hypothetical protein [Anaeromyxobacteraceae bacterium]